MNVVGIEKIDEGRKRHADSAKRLAAWLAEAKVATWKSFQELGARYPSVDRVGDRYVFNIGGNRYRLIVRINFAVGLVQVRWFGTHAEYDRIDVERI